MPPAPAPWIQLQPIGVDAPARPRAAAHGPLPPEILAFIEALAEADAARDFAAAGLPADAPASHGPGR